jgi:hypothetical protein
MLPLIAAAIGTGLVRGGLGALAARKESRRQKGFIRQAYDTGRQRLDLSQGDVRQSQAEGLLARGLGAGGSIGLGGPVAPGAVPSVSGAHDLAGQQVADQRREQALEQTSLRDQRDRALSDTKAATQQGYVNAAVSGIQSGLSVYSGGKDLAALSGGGGAAAGVAQGVPGTGVAPWGGVDPVDPLGRGPWSVPTTGQFNIYGRGMS